MWEWIVEHLYSDPERMVARGQACAGLGCFLLAAGVVGWAAKSIVGVVQLRASMTPPQTLAELFGTPLATFWMPEGFGFVVAVAFVALGGWLIVTGRRLRSMFYGR